jgi:hypothetical protein
MSDNKWWQFGARRQGQEAQEQSAAQSTVPGPGAVTAPPAVTEQRPPASADVVAPAPAPSPAESFVSITLTEAEAVTVTTALHEHEARHVEASEPTAYSREYEYEEVQDAVAVATEQSALASGVTERLDAAVAEHVPAASAPVLDPETGRAVGVGPNGEIGAGYVEPAEADDVNTVVPLTLSEPEADMLRNALDRYDRDTQGARDREPDLDVGEVDVDVEYDQALDARLERAGRVDEKIEGAVMARSADASSTSSQSEPEGSVRRSLSFPRSANETLTTERTALSASGGVATPEASARGAAGAQAPFRSGQSHVSSSAPER